ncbi:S-layer homology domain-containing protein [Dysosmobacter sp.]|uniref:S-layer homology domain-containing protein n=1 Tax=Dysosmobacter sp. TaxID=2591382 RepID=UPI003AEF31A5
MKHKLLSILLCLAMALSLLPTAALAEGATGAGPIKVGGKTYSSFSDAVNAAAPDENGVITYEISGKVDVTDTGWVQVAKAGLADLSKVAFVGINDDAEICITGGLAILADQKYDIDVSFTNLKLSKPNPTYGGDYGHSTNYFTCWLRNTGAAENTVTYTNCVFPNGVCNNQYGKTVFDRCQFTNDTSGKFNLWNYGGNTEVKGSTFTGTRGIKTYNEGDLDVAPTVTVTDTSFDGLTEKAAIVASKPTNITLTTVTATDCTKGLLQKDIEGSKGEQKVTIEANGTGISGDFNITAQKDAEAAKNEFNITAGTFTGEINNDYLAPGANFDATTGEVKMSYVAKIGDTEYPTLADAFAAADKTGDTVIELLDDINMTGKSWTPVSVDGNHGQGVITLTGNGKTITGLSAPLFAGGFAGKSGIVINNLTLENVNLNDTGSEYAGTGFGAFICAVDSMPTISLTNCHVKGGTIESTSGARVGGLIGWTSGYNKPTDGPVDTKVTLTNCSVENVTIEAKGSVGGLIGHAGANPATYHTITGCTVKDSTLTCTETGKSWRVGDLVGTANDGQITVDAATSASQNTLTQENADPQKPKDSIFGRDAVNDTGLVIVDNKVVAAGTAYGNIVNKNANEVLVEVSKGHWVKPNEGTVAMIGATEYPTLPDAITAAKDGDTIKLLKDVTVTNPIEVTKSMTLDLNGHVLTAATASTATVKNSAIWVTAEKVNLTIDGTTAGSGMTMGDTHDTNWEAKVWGFVDLREGSAGSTVTVNGGSYTGSTCASDSYHYTALFTVGSESKLVLNNVSAETDERVVKASSCGEVIVSGGTYNITGINAFLGAAFETKTASFTDMKLTAKYGGCVQVGSNATLENCEIKVTDIRTGDGTYLNCAVAVQYGGTATVKSGTYTAPYAAYVYNSGGTINIENGTFTGVVRADATTDTTAVINIKNGSFNGEIQKGGGPGSETISITGGTFSFDPSTKVKNNGTDYIVKRAGSEGAYTYTVLAKSGLTSGVYLTDPSGALASNYYVSSTANGVWTVSYSAPSSGGGSSSSSRRYDVSAPSVKHGDVTVSPKSASKGDTVTITVKPDSGYELDTLTVKDASGSKIKVKDKGDGKFTFTMPASKVTVSAEFAEIETLDFADVPTDAYYYEAVKWAAKKGITGGIGNGLFGPNQPCTRAQIVTFLWRAAGSPEPKAMSSFADVSTDAYYAKAVAWAVENGITTGTGDGKFSPDATCTRAQSVTFLFRAIGKLVDSKAEFSDVLTDSYYANAVAWAVENGVTNGIGDGLFGPDNSCTRAQIVTFLFRAYQGK